MIATTLRSHHAPPATVLWSIAKLTDALEALAARRQAPALCPTCETPQAWHDRPCPRT